MIESEVSILGLSTSSDVLLELLVTSIIINVIMIIAAIAIFRRFGKKAVLNRIRRITRKKESLPVAATMPQIYLKNVPALAFSRHVKTQGDYFAWKETVLAKFREIRRIPTNGDLVPKSVEPIRSEDQGRIALKKYSMEAFDGDKIIFYSVLPKVIEGKLAAVIVIPGSGNQGVSDVLKINGEFSKFDYQNGIGITIAEKQYAVFAIENRGWGERTINPGTMCDLYDKTYCSGTLFYEQLDSLGYDIYGLQIADTLQLLNYVRGLDYINKDKIAVVGVSLGGVLAMAVSMLSNDIKATVVASGLVSVCQTWAIGLNVRGALRYFDNPDLASTIAPRSLYLSYGRKDQPAFRYEAATLQSANSVKKAYSLLGAENNLEVIVHDGGHTYDVHSVLRFLEKTLGNS